MTTRCVVTCDACGDQMARPADYARVCVQRVEHTRWVDICWACFNDRELNPLTQALAAQGQTEATDTEEEKT